MNIFPPIRIVPPAPLKPTANEVAWALFYQRQRENAALEMEIITTRIGIQLMRNAQRANRVVPPPKTNPLLNRPKLVIQHNPPPKAKPIHHSYFTDRVARKAGLALNTVDVCLKHDGLDKHGRRRASLETVARVKKIADELRKAA